MGEAGRYRDPLEEGEGGDKCGGAAGGAVRRQGFTGGAGGQDRAVCRGAKGWRFWGRENPGPGGLEVWHGGCGGCGVGQGVGILKHGMQGSGADVWWQGGVLEGFGPWRSYAQVLPHPPSSPVQLVAGEAQLGCVCGGVLPDTSSLPFLCPRSFFKVTRNRAHAQSHYWNILPLERDSE